MKFCRQGWNENFGSAPQDDWMTTEQVDCSTAEIMNADLYTSVKIIHAVMRRKPTSVGIVYLFTYLVIGCLETRNYDVI